MRRPPQSNCPPGTVPTPDHGRRLGSKLNQAGIPTATPPRLAPQLPSLPAILHRSSPNTIPGCSKAPRGLFVLLRVRRIFTPISISPGPSSRQCPTRYAIRAGRNLPDKEFRYLRTVHHVSPTIGFLVSAVYHLVDPSCRHEDRTISSSPETGGTLHRSGNAQRMVSEDSSLEN